MKGGKAGRKRTAPGSAAGRAGGGGRGTPKTGGAPRAPAGAPKKGSRKKPHFGGRPASGDE